MTYYSKVEHRMCQDCGHDTRLMGELYMLQFDLWLQILTDTGHADMLCITCVERRLGRKLGPRDFIRCPLNDEEPWTRRQSLLLRSRLARYT